MHIVEPYAKIIRFMGFESEPGAGDAGIDSIKFIEETGRKCYRSEGSSTAESYKQFVGQHALASRHTSMLRFSAVVIDFMVDRGVAQEITRHGKTLDFQHESQRYCNYSKGKFGNSVGFIRPRGMNVHQDEIWTQAMKESEYSYFCLLKTGLKPQLAADALPRATASLLTAIGNFQAWRHFLLTRTTTQCHPKMLDVTNDLLEQFKQTFPIIFDDIEPHGDFAVNMQKPQ